MADRSEHANSNQTPRAAEIFLSSHYWPRNNHFSRELKISGASTAGANDSTVIAVTQEKAKSRLKDEP
jgi:hypothetical protein